MTQTSNKQLPLADVMWDQLSRPFKRGMTKEGSRIGLAYVVRSAKPPIHDTVPPEYLELATAVDNAYLMGQEI